MNTTLIAAASLLFAATLAPSVGAAETATITLDLDVLGNDYKDCIVTVPAGADGAAALDAAAADGCIGSWSGTTYSFGTFVDCIDNICGVTAAIFVGTYWNFAVNGESAFYGIDGYRAADGDVLGFDYVTYAYV